ncbi:MAG: flagellar filament capping protein FliD, partial [Phycisphaerae bacterium]
TTGHTTTTGKRIIGGVNSTLLSTLNGGSGLSGSTLTVSANGQSVNVDITGLETLEEVITAAREQTAAAGINAQFAFDANGTRLIATSGDAAAPLTISGDAAESLGLAGEGLKIRGENLQRRYINENTKLETLNNGAGVSLGRIHITNANGVSASLNLQSEAPKNLQDVINSINELNIGVRAEINQNGDGLQIVDESGGAGVLKITDESGTTARDLNILGDAENGAIDGSFEFNIELGNSGSLDDLATAISGTSLATARVINDGSGVAPYRLSISSTASGTAGALLIDSADGTFNVETLSRAQDARVIIGSDAETGIAITSSSNTIENIVGGLTIDLQSVSDDPVTVQVSQDVADAVETFKAVVKDYNAALERIGQLSDFDSETEARGVLLGESVPRTVERRLYSVFSRQIPGATGNIKRLRDIGIRFEAGAKLSFDEEKFRTAYGENPDEVVRFFTDAETGASKYLSEELKKISEADGLIDRRNESLESRKTLLERRVEQLDGRLERKRERLLRQFQAMENALSQLQGQQSSLSSFSPLSAG